MGPYHINYLSCFHLLKDLVKLNLDASNNGDNDDDDSGVDSARSGEMCSESWSGIANQSTSRVGAWQCESSSSGGMC